MPKSMKISLTILFILFGLVFAWDAFRSFMMKKFFASFKMPPAAISTTIAKEETWQPSIQTVGTLQANQGVDISAEASGIISSINFESGQYVRKGDLLVKINDDIEQADLKNSLAAYNLTKITYQRTLDLYKKNAASKSQLDENEAKMKQAEALYEKELAIIDEKNIHAPFDGRAGIRMVNLGQYVSPGVQVVSLQSLDPMLVQFYLPEQYLRVIYPGQPVNIGVQTYPDQEFKGKITAINSKIDPKTHNILVQAQIPNPENKLYPGLFANIKLLLPLRQHIIALPQTAITYSLFGDSIFVVKQTGKDKSGKPILEAIRHYVTLGESIGSQIAIEKGIAPGDVVVTSGQLKIDNGSPVVINNRVKM